MDILRSTNSIKERIEELPYLIVYNELPDNFSPPVHNGVMVPYINIRFGSPILTSGGRGIIGTRSDMHEMMVLMTCFAYDDDSLNIVCNSGINKLQGFKPDDGGELRLFGGMSFGGSHTSVQPSTHVRSMTFSYPMNLTIEQG